MNHPLAVLLALGLLLGSAAGFLMHRSDFCLAGAFRDLLLFRRGFGMRCLLLAVAVSTVLFELCRAAGLVPLYPFPLLKPASPANLLGGALFGIGMTLAGGCVVGTLYRAGAGHLLSAVAVVGLVVGSGLFAEFQPLAGMLARHPAFDGALTPPQATGASPALLSAAALALLALLFRLRPRASDWTRPARAAGYLQPWKAAVGLAVVGTASLVAVGMPLGVTTSYAKAAAALETVLWPRHAAGVALFKAQPLDYAHPWTGLRLKGGAGPGLDGIAVIQFPLIAGLLLGGAVSALSVGEFDLRLSAPPAQTASAFAGGVLMALGSRVGAGCNLWHLLGGIPAGALGSLVFAAGLLPGTWIGVNLLSALLERTAQAPEAREGAAWNEPTTHES